MKNSSGFTVIEVISVIALLAAAGMLFFSQKQNLQISHDDEMRKTAINAMHYSLEESFYKDNGHYPPSIDESILMTVDPELFTDPYGVKLGEPGSDYRYEAIGCTDSECDGYRLSAALVNEADYVKTNQDDN